jgi:molybdopterin molybdotransferase
MLIDLDRAHQLIERTEIQEPKAITVKTWESYYKIIASDIKAPKNIPENPLSAMDGYAIHSRDLDRFGKLKIAGKIFLGDQIPELKPGEAYYIVTGAPIPKGADSIVRVEAARIENGYLIPVEKVWPGKDIVDPGDVVRKDSYIARRGDIVSPYTVSLLLLSGVYEVPIYDLGIGIISIGSELSRFDEFSDGNSKVDSISPLIIGLLRFGSPRYLGVVPDNLTEIKERISDSISKLYSIITVGGTSVGERDLVKKAVKELGGKLLFEGVNVNILKRGSIGLLNR